MRDNDIKKLRLFFVFFLFLSMLLVAEDRSWGKTGDGTGQLIILYSSNTSGFTEPTG